MTTRINFNIDPQLKAEAMRKAKERGLSLSTVLNAATRAFAKDQLKIGLVGESTGADISLAPDNVAERRIAPDDPITELPMKAPLPNDLRRLLWSYDSDAIDLGRHRQTIVLQTINYGTLAHWRWLAETYGRDVVREVLTSLPATAIRPQARRLASLVFGVERFNHVPRGTH